MKQALGLVEISGLSTAVVVADTMAKAANVRILEIENTKGLGYMTIKIVGDVGAVNAAVNAGKQIGTANGKLVSWKVIPRPSDYVDQTFCCPEPPVPPSPPKKEAQEETEAEVEVKAETMEEVKAGEPEETGLEEIAPEDTEQETEAEPAEAGPEPKIEAEPIEIKSEPLVEAEPTRTGTVDPAEPEVPDSPETPPERPKKTAKRTTSAKSTSTTRHKKN
ncbi:BMC domain-containing protein [Enterocloster bolteae]|uniref:BMC domain-containing protein n=1 Tax=Enterocloster bolteae TaxID=208479 RepID=UPI00189BA0ED|nr:BMC domain-containing protein [Enterocloster bolteae]